jgi:hypothetical protein
MSTEAIALIVTQLELRQGSDFKSFGVSANDGVSFLHTFEQLGLKSEVLEGTF